MYKNLFLGKPYFSLICLTFGFIELNLLKSTPQGIISIWFFFTSISKSSLITDSLNAIALVHFLAHFMINFYFI